MTTLVTKLRNASDSLKSITRSDVDQAVETATNTAVQMSADFVSREARTVTRNLTASVGELLVSKLKRQKKKG